MLGTIIWDITGDTRSLDYMSYSLNCVKGVYKGLYRGLLHGVIKGDIRSLDYGSYALVAISPRLLA